ncbi:MAG: hypothetical protein PARBA_03240 [Parabacteroides sp.]
MKQKYYIGFIAFVLTIVLAGCIHDFPVTTPDGEEGIDPTLVEVNTEVTLDLELVPLEIITQKNARPETTKSRVGEQTDYRRRFIIEAWHEGKPESRQVTVADDAEEDSDGKITLPIHLKLHALDYTLVVWTDYVAAGTDTDLYYDTKDLQYVACTAPYTGSTPYRDCLYGTAALDLRQYRDEWNAKVQVKVDMVRPLAKYELIATDVAEFLGRTAQQRAQGESYTVTFSYSFYIPAVFDVLAGKPCESWPEISFTLPLALPEEGETFHTVGTDFIFANGGEASVLLTMEIRDSRGNRMSRVSGIDVPYRRGHLTTLKGAFLTSEMKGGVEIDTEWDGEVEIDMDNL